MRFIIILAGVLVLVWGGIAFVAADWRWMHNIMEWEPMARFLWLWGVATCALGAALINSVIDD